jgi:hypothetical protein
LETSLKKKIDRTENPELTSDTIRNLLKTPQKLAAHFHTHKLSDKLHRQRDEEYRQALGHAYLAYKEIQAAENEAEIIAELKKLPGQNRSSNVAAVILRTFIGYDGPDQRQYLSRDKTALLALEDGNITPEAAARHLKDVGGIVAYVGAYRKKMRKQNGVRNADSKITNLNQLIPDIMGRDGDRAVILVRLDSFKPRKFHIVQKLKLPKLSKSARILLWKVIKRVAKSSRKTKSETGDE